MALGSADGAFSALVAAAVAAQPIPYRSPKRTLGIPLIKRTTSLCAWGLKKEGWGGAGEEDPSPSKKVKREKEEEDHETQPVDETEDGAPPRRPPTRKKKTQMLIFIAETIPLQRPEEEIKEFGGGGRKKGDEGKSRMVIRRPDHGRGGGKKGKGGRVPPSMPETLRVIQDYPAGGGVKINRRDMLLSLGKPVNAHLALSAHCNAVCISAVAPHDPRKSVQPGSWYLECSEAIPLWLKLRSELPVDSPLFLSTTWNLRALFRWLQERPSLAHCLHPFWDDYANIAHDLIRRNPVIPQNRTHFLSSLVGA